MLSPRTRTLALEHFEAAPGGLYSLDVAAHLAGVSRRTMLLHCRWRLIEPVIAPPYGALYFGIEAIRVVRRAEYLRHALGVNLPGVRVALNLLQEIETLHRERDARTGARGFAG